MKGRAKSRPIASSLHGHADSLWRLRATLWFALLGAVFSPVAIAGLQQAGSSMIRHICDGSTGSARSERTPSFGAYWLVVLDKTVKAGGDGVAGRRDRVWLGCLKLAPVLQSARRVCGGFRR